MNFSQDAWREIAPIYDAILEHPFNVELAAGTLSIARFRHYVLQDAVFLIAFGRALSITAARAHVTVDMVQFAQRVREALVVERALHERYFQQFGIAREYAERVEASPTCLNYNNFLIATAYHAPYEVAVAALLPCFWIYYEVGGEIHKRAAAGNPYQAWIDTYADEEYGSSVQELIVIADRVAQAVSTPTRQWMLAVFRRAAQLEWMFWDAAWRLEHWPLV